MRVLLSVSLSLLLCGCQSLLSDDPDSPYYAIPNGSVLELHRILTLPADTVSLYLQDGELVADSSLLRHYDPYCKFEMWSRVDRRRTIDPERFRVGRVVRSYEYVKMPRAPVRLAGPIVFDIDRGGPTAIIETTTLYLTSERQPDVYRIGCEQWAEPSMSRPLTLSEIRHALGGLFTLELIPNAGSVLAPAR